ncbi:hypothetical protein L6164_013510 [Bauhinia variegata]|uniref:Uncharacterized protein n=1 Tax=Bauhinia variegata TaxID=167791 RepID=A0ACB9NI04_BAUVA|nr:hypothetical protein L6164_013510 [Bauhinia variegata]
MFSKTYPFHLLIFFFVGISWMNILAAASSSPTNFAKFSGASSSSSSSTTKPFILHNNPSHDQLFVHSLQSTIDKANHAQALLSNLTISHRKSHDTEIVGGFIDCMELLDDTLDQLQNVASIEDIGSHAVVAKDGSGTHMTIGEALNELKASLGGGGGRRTVIHVKAGTYNENIKIPTKQKNVMLVGDGKGKTVIVGSRNSKDGWTAFQSATVAAMGDGFIARGITFINSAGPTKNQAVALRVGSDKSVIFRCSILGYQDTLYTHSKRQFYRDTDIYGTIDFIFGNSAVVLQNCNIFPRKPLSNQQNYITAQGRINPNQNTGISIHNCKITAASDLAAVKRTVTTYLGRPWKQYSRTVIMQSFIDDMVHPAGWSPWSGSFGLGTLYYGEYMNSGPGASTRRRVKWSSYHPSLASIEAQKFTVGGFIDGNLWLPFTGVSFDSGLLG